MGRAITIILSGFIMVLSVYRMNLHDFAREAVADTVDFYSEKQARLIAESGVRFMMTKLALEPAWRGQVQDLEIGSGLTDIKVRDRNDIGADVVQIHSDGAFNGSLDSVNVIFTLVQASERFSRFSYFSNREDNIWFYTDDTLSGPVHTNGRFKMSGTPVFYGLVSSVSSTYDTFGATFPDFTGGTEFGRTPIDLAFSFTELQDAAISGGNYVVNSDLYLKFQNDGSYQSKAGSGGSWQTFAIPENGVIASNRNVYVEGVLNGRITVASTKNIYITNDIVYADDPVASPDSDDLLCLVALQNVIIKDNSDNREVIRVHAAVLARDGSFKAENINFSPSTRLELFGGVVQDRRGVTGMLGNSEQGYKKHYTFDKRLVYMFPPYYPVAHGSVAENISKAKITILYWK